MRVRGVGSQKRSLSRSIQSSSESLSEATSERGRQVGVGLRTRYDRLESARAARSVKDKLLPLALSYE
eukprot:2785722-Pleurochrysis_carterae.AAC.3